MRIYAGICALNESAYIEAVLKNLYPVCAGLIVVEGATKWAWDLADERGLSVDGTGGIVKNFPDPEGKIQYLPIGRVQEMPDLRNRYLKEIPEDAAILVADADCFWFHDDLERAGKYLDDHPETGGLVFYQVLFRGDLSHAVNSLPSNLLYRKKCIGEYGLGEMGDIPGGLREFAEGDLDPPLRVLHAGWAQPAEKIRQKYLWTARWAQEKLGHYPGDGPHTLKVRAMQCFDFYMGTEYKAAIEYGGDYPQALRDHPFFDRDRREVLFSPWGDGHDD